MILSSRRRIATAMAVAVGCIGLMTMASTAGASTPSATSKPGAVDMQCRHLPFSVSKPSTVGSVLQQGAKAPDFTAERLDCGKISLHDVIGTGQNGHVTFVNFFASWCEYCIAEAPDLAKFYNEYHSKGLNGIGVDTADDGPPAGNPSLFYKKFHFPFPSVWDPAAPTSGVSTVTSAAEANDTIWNAYATQPAIACIPTTFWLHKDGTIAVVYVNQMTPAAMLQNYKWAEQTQAQDDADPNYIATEAQNSKCIPA